jgi:hypothetical protein
MSNVVKGVAMVVAAFLAAASFLLGLYLLIDAALFLRGFDLQGASAPQITQVYTMAIYHALVAIGVLLLCAICLGIYTNQSD